MNMNSLTAKSFFMVLYQLEENGVISLSLFLLPEYRNFIFLKNPYSFFDNLITVIQLLHRDQASPPQTYARYDRPEGSGGVTIL